MRNPRILFIDAYDSFSNNIISLLEAELHASVQSVKIDDARFVLNDEAFYEFLHGFDAVVAGPGPGHPANATDIGLIASLWSLADDSLIPVLGICLGFQSLCLAFGATVERLREPRHGLVTPVTHTGKDIFGGSGEVLATQYHSLHVSLRARHPSSDTDDLWESTSSCAAICPLAWDLSDATNGPIFMAGKHIDKPLWGVQYHPESICTNLEGRRLVQNWWREVCTWQGRKQTLPPTSWTKPQTPGRRVDSGRTSEDCNSVQWQSMLLPEGLAVIQLVDMIRKDSAASEPILLESGTRDGNPVNAETGRFSIIGLQDASSTHIQYSTSGSRLRVVSGGRTVLERPANMADVFEHLDHFIAGHRAVGGATEVPFWGGLVGYMSYEAGLETIDVAPAHSESNHPDVWFVFVERSVVIDHVEGRLYLQNLKDDEWISATTEKIRQLRANTFDVSPQPPESTVVAEPSREEYVAKVHDCQAQLRAGSSYELCLTDTTLIDTPEDPWSLYQRLRLLNPAPFGAYIHLTTPSTTDPSLSIASSSPERFLSWNRTGTCQFRPIKGTVKKTPDLTRTDAEAILRSPKEQAENLMIVDLIRHDLSGVEGISTVHVPKLMQIEEYATVYQLVSVIAGHAPNPLRVLSASLPPGSMTGAPKKRSCELLRSIEGASHARGVYSGVIGYLDVGGGGDFSVAIRTAFRWGDEGVWGVGAGGAVTVLSEAGAEWEEMRGKRESVLRAFGCG